jgi:hypothetical protein
MWGLPELLQLDNAPEFHSRALVRGAQEYGIRIDYRPPGTPHSRNVGWLMRVNRWQMRCLHSLAAKLLSMRVKRMYH